MISAIQFFYCFVSNYKLKYTQNNYLNAIYKSNQIVT